MTNKIAQNQVLIQSGSLIKVLFKLALPIMIASFVMTLYNLIDAYFVGQISDVHLAAVSFSFSLVFMTYAIATGLKLAITTMISKAVGAKEYKSASEIFTVAIIFSAIISIIVIIVSQLFVPSILNFMTKVSNDNLFTEYTINYTVIIMYGIPAVFLFLIFQGQRQAVGDTVSPVILQSISVVINIVLDYVLIVRVDMGVEGAAIATIVSQYTMIFLGLYMILDKKSLVRFSIKNTNFFKFDYYRLFVIALPAILNDFIVGLSFLILNANAVSFGTGIIAATATGNRYNNLMQIPIFAISVALTSVVGQLYGAKNLQRVRKAFFISLKSTIVIGIFLLIFIYIFRIPLVSLLLKSDSAEVLLFGYRYTVLICLSSIIFGLVQVNLAVINAFGYTNISLLLNTFRMWALRIPLFYLIKPFFGKEALWIAMILSISMIYAISLPIVLKVIKRKEKQIEIEQLAT